MIPKKIFREYDIRGLADTELGNDFVQKLGKAYAVFLSKKGVELKVVVGSDNRISSPRIKEELINSLVVSGCQVIDIGETLSPIAYFAREYLRTDGMIMITASHNGAEYNGFKLACGKGTIYGSEIQKIREIIEKGEFLKGDGSVEHVDVFSAYKQQLLEKIKIEKKLKVVLDCGNGTAGHFAEEIFKGWGVEVIGQHNQSDGSFPNHNPDPIKIGNIKDLLDRVKVEKADLGIGIDGDGDRLGAVNEKGEIVWGDMLMILYSRELLQKFPGEKIIVEVKTSQALSDDILAHGGKPLLWKTGHSLIKAKMLEENVKLAGEMSGHMFFADEYWGFDDALYSAGRLLRIISQSGKTFSELFSDVPRFFSTPEIRIPISDDKKFEIVKKLTQAFKKSYDVNDVDGARVLFPGGWALVRASNTQPAIILRAEGKTKKDLEEIKLKVSEYFKPYPEIIIDWENQGD